MTHDTGHYHVMSNGVTVPYVNSRTSTERLEWVTENISKKYYLNLHYDYVERIYRSATYYFEDYKDAVAFKMRWG